MSGLGARMALAAATVAAALAALPAGAGAVVLEAESVLPPGQSGFVSITGLTSGTGSPHLTDQVELYTSFTFKPATFDQPGQTEQPRAGVRIVRDRYGVPAIHGDSDYDAWWGVGYAVAQDRLFQLELFKRATSGRLSEILGSGFLADDIVARRDYYTDAEIDAQLAKVPDKLLARAGAYRDGINAWIEETRLRPGQLPGEFAALGVAPVDWTLRDTGRVGVFLARTVPSGDGGELDNARALQAIGPRAFFRLHPIRTRGRRPTVPAREGRFPAQPDRKRRHENSGFQRSHDFIKALPLPGAEAGAPAAAASRSRQPVDAGTLDLDGRGPHRVLGPVGGSYMWAIRDRKRKRTYLYNGPQLGFSAPELFVEFELHSPEQDVRGVSAASIPLVGIGHNGHVAWGFTSGLSDEDDLYVEELGGSPEAYRFRGEERQMECRDEGFTWREAPTGLPGLVRNPGAPAGSRSVRICRTLHGPVQERTDKHAFARRYAIWGREIETIVGLTVLNDAKDIEEVAAAMRQVTWNENVIAADDRGNIGYWHPGLHPLRPRLWDERLPYPGTGEAEWRGLLPVNRLPRVINPRQGWLANWNNPPSVGWTNGDGPARERLAGEFHRVRLLERLAARVARKPSYAASRGIDRRSGTTAQQRPFFGRRLSSVRRRAQGRTREMLNALLAWKGDYHSTDDARTVDPGVAIWEELKTQAAEVALAPLGEKAMLLAGSTSKQHQFDITNAEAYALRALAVADLLKAADATAAKLAERFGGDDVSKWREPRRTIEVEPQGAASAPDQPFFDRGTWQQSVSLGP